MPKPINENGYQSIQGRPIDVHIFGSGSKVSLIMAAIHGDEQDGVNIVRAIHSTLAELPEDSLADQRVVLIPIANPDGYAANTRQNANGIDLNRNFPDKTFGTGKQPKKFYGGKAPASEPETRAILDIVQRHKPRLIISLHAALACVNYNGSCVRIARRISKATGLPAVGDVGYPTPGSMGNYYGFQRRLPVITLELPHEPVDPHHYASILLQTLGLPG